MQPNTNLSEKLSIAIRVTRNIGYALLHLGAGLIRLTGVDIDVTTLRGQIFPSATSPAPDQGERGQ